MLITSVGLFEQRRPTRADGCDLNSHICKVAIPSTDAFKVLVGLQLLSLNRCLQRNATDLGRAKSLGSGRFVCCQIAAENDQIPRCNSERDSGGSAGSNLAGDTRSTRLGCRCTRAHHLPIGGAFVGVRVVP